MADGPLPDDPLHVLRAELDQAIAIAPEVARVSKGMFNAYIAEGFSEKQALYLTVTQIHSGAGPPA